MLFRTPTVAVLPCQVATISLNACLRCSVARGMGWTPLVKPTLPGSTLPTT